MEESRLLPADWNVRPGRDQCEARQAIDSIGHIDAGAENDHAPRIAGRVEAADFGLPIRICDVEHAQPGFASRDIGVVVVKRDALTLWPYSACSSHFTGVQSPPSSGSVKENVVPSPSLVSNQISPPCSSTSFLVMLRPRPVPPTSSRSGLSAR